MSHQSGEGLQVPHLRALAACYSSGEPVESVSVVGNAPLDPDSSRAAHIDSGDLVFRVNGFALDLPGSPPSVGTRADVVLFNRALRASPWFFADYRKRLYLMVEPGRLHWEAERWPGWWPPDLGHVVLSNREIVLPLSRELGLASEVEPVWATTGVIAVWLARTLFPAARVAVAGLSMIEDPDQTWWPHSYGEGSPVGAEHLLRAESTLLRSWVADGQLTNLA